MRHDYLCEQILTPEECIEIRNLFFKNLNTELQDIPTQGANKTSDVYIANYKNIKTSLKKVEDFALSINEKYFRYDLHDLKDDNMLILDAYDSNKNGQHGYHKHQTDFKEDFDFKLTVLINISDYYYEGGYLKIFNGKGEQRLEEFQKEGTVCILPSYVLHGIDNTTLGVKKTITQFYTGPRFR